jgi:hypothetical protein
VSLKEASIKQRESKLNVCAMSVRDIKTSPQCVGKLWFGVTGTRAVRLK